MAYYKDDCRIHLSDKNESRWFSQKLRRKRLLYIIIRRERLNNIRLQGEITFVDTKKEKRLSS